MPQVPNRQSHRLTGYDYTRNGFYFITIISQDRVERFGDIVDGEMRLNDAGRMVQSVWNATINEYNNVGSDIFVIMPNHFHCIIEIDDGENGVGARPCVRPSQYISPDLDKRVDTRPTPTNKKQTIGDVICAFKSLTTNRYINGVKLGLVEPFRKRLWQRDYYDHIIRNENEYMAIEQYIINNPQNWESDSLRKGDGLMEERGCYEYDWKSYL